MRSEDLIHGLAADLRPVRPARHPAAATLLWCGVAAAVILAAVLVSGPRPDLAARLAGIPARLTYPPRLTLCVTP